MLQQRPHFLALAHDQQGHADTGLPLCQGNFGFYRSIGFTFLGQLLLQPGIGIGHVGGVSAIDCWQSNLVPIRCVSRPPRKSANGGISQRPTPFKASVHWAITNGFWMTSVAATSPLTFSQRGSSGAKTANAQAARNRWS